MAASSHHLAQPEIMGGAFVTLTTAEVYVQELSPGIRPIAGRQTGVAAIVGTFPRGPVDQVVRITSTAELAEIFAADSSDLEAPLAVRQFFANGGRSAWIVRAKSNSRRKGASARAGDIIGRADRGTGLHALPDTADLLLTPDTARMTAAEAGQVAAAAVGHADRRRMIYLHDIPHGDKIRRTSRAVTAWLRANPKLRHANAATYFPRLLTTTPGKRTGDRAIAPGGSIAGLYARTDRQRGIWKAPAGVDAGLFGVSGLETDVGDADLARLTDRSVNVIKTFPGAGIVAWGARSLEPAGSGAEWRYVPVRRLALFIEASIETGVQWTVFEPNGEPLWAQIRLNVSSFLHLLFRNGAFQGATPRDAYFVRCDRGTHTAADIDQGLVNITVGFAPVRPAEFVILRIQQRTADSHN